jgi:hypothetical protein
VEDRVGVVDGTELVASGVVGDPPARDADPHGTDGWPGEGFVRAGEGVDAVVVGCMREGGDLVEKRLAVAAGHKLDEAVVGGGGDRPARTSLGPVARTALTL